MRINRGDMEVNPGDVERRGDKFKRRGDKFGRRGEKLGRRENMLILYICRNNCQATRDMPEYDSTSLGWSELDLTLTSILIGPPYYVIGYILVVSINFLVESSKYMLKSLTTWWFLSPNNAYAIVIMDRT